MNNNLKSYKVEEVDRQYNGKKKNSYILKPENNPTLILTISK